MSKHNDILDDSFHPDNPDDETRIIGQWTLVASLIPEAVGPVVAALEEAGIEEARFEKEKLSVNQTGIIPISAQELGNIKTLVYVRNQDAEQVKALIDALPEPEPYVSELSGSDEALHKLWLKVLILMVAFLGGYLYWRLFMMNL